MVTVSVLLVPVAVVLIVLRTGVILDRVGLTLIVLNWDLFVPSPSRRGRCTAQTAPVRKWGWRRTHGKRRCGKRGVCVQYGEKRVIVRERRVWLQRVMSGREEERYGEEQTYKRIVGLRDGRRDNG